MYKKSLNVLNYYYYLVNMQLFTKIYAKTRYSINQVEEISFEGCLAYLNECSIYLSKRTSPINYRKESVHRIW